ncbi:hypothetical protein CK203_114105 [Vitis vinifera]|uniref:Uncharacterized protein n=1 Tax=Vitis vinifera TaxID=29760 RepID=A0A438CRF0_VITVI|nr:hypothetical protein CK203_114105 [Vitis vinifera]
MEEAKVMKTPMSSSIKLDKDEKGKSIDSTMYRGMIGGGSQDEKMYKVEKLIALTTLTRRSTGPGSVNRVTYELGGPIISIVREVEIQLDLESICNILDIALVGLKVYESKVWPTVQDFEPSGHRDEVSYLEAFLVDSILMERWIHMGYLMMMHMISCCESTTRVLTYDSFLTRVFTDVGVDLSGETDFEALSTYDTYDEQSLGRMKFEKAPDGS